MPAIIAIQVRRLFTRGRVSTSASAVGGALDLAEIVGIGVAVIIAILIIAILIIYFKRNDDSGDRQTREIVEARRDRLYDIMARRQHELRDGQQRADSDSDREVTALRSTPLTPR